MNIFCIGDIVGKAGRKIITDLLPAIKEEFSIDLVIANAENAAGGAGLTPRIANGLFREGCDVLTLGDHAWDRQELFEYLDAQKDRVLRPANFPPESPGRGWTVVEVKDKKIGVLSLLGNVFMRYHIDSPFRFFQNNIQQFRREADMIVVDLHAEATSEKIAFGFFVDGQVSAVVGSHTHVQTADENVLPKGTGYITDLGMTGPYDSVIGQNKEKIIKRFLTSIPMRFEVAKDDPWLCGVVIQIDDQTGLAQTVIRVQRRGP